MNTITVPLAEWQRARKNEARYLWLRARFYKHEGGLEVSIPGAYDNFVGADLGDGVDEAIDVASRLPREVRMSDLLTDAELRSRTWPLPAPVLKHIDTLAARVKELIEINLVTEGQRASLKRRLYDAELSLHVFDPGGTSEYWLKYSGPTPDADRPEHGK